MVTYLKIGQYLVIWSDMRDSSPCLLLLLGKTLFQDATEHFCIFYILIRNEPNFKDQVINLEFCRFTKYIFIAL